jgi:hypothetical protein
VDEQSRSDRPWETTPAGATISGPTFGARPGGNDYARTRSGLAALPSRPPPSPHFSGPREPEIGRPIGRVSPPWYKARWVKVTGILLTVAVLAVAAVKLIGGGSDDGIDASPGAVAPSGFRMIATDSYQFAVPKAWNTKALDAQVMTASAATAGRNDRALTVATDPRTQDTIDVVPYETSSASLQKQVLSKFESDFRNGVAGTQIVTLRVDPATVHGFPAAKLAASIVARNGLSNVVSTLVETTEGIFQITVTSADAERAASLAQRVLPTFDTR